MRLLMCGTLSLLWLHGRRRWRHKSFAPKLRHPAWRHGRPCCNPGPCCRSCCEVLPRAHALSRQPIVRQGEGQGSWAVVEGGPPAAKLVERDMGGGAGDGCGRGRVRHGAFGPQPGCAWGRLGRLAQVQVAPMLHGGPGRCRCNRCCSRQKRVSHGAAASRGRGRYRGFVHGHGRPYGRRYGQSRVFRVPGGPWGCIRGLLRRVRV